MAVRYSGVAMGRRRPRSFPTGPAYGFNPRSFLLNVFVADYKTPFPLPLTILFFSSASSHSPLHHHLLILFHLHPLLSYPLHSLSVPIPFLSFTCISAFTFVLSTYLLLLATSRSFHPALSLHVHSFQALVPPAPSSLPNMHIP